jgi:hypothetical protein
VRFYCGLIVNRAVESTAGVFGRLTHSLPTLAKSSTCVILRKLEIYLLSVNERTSNFRSASSYPSHVFFFSSPLLGFLAFSMRH